MLSKRKSQLTKLAFSFKPGCCQKRAVVYPLDSPNSTICKALRTPKGDEEKKKLYLDAFLSPQLYKIISTEWNGKKITHEGLKISLIRDHEFSDIGAKQASKIFFDNATLLGLIDSDNNFNIDAEIKIDLNTAKEKKAKAQSSNDGSKKGANKPKVSKEILSQPSTPNSGSNSTKKITIFVRGQELHFPVLEDMAQSDWDAVIKQLQNIKSFSK